MVATFKETCALIPRRYVSEPGKSIPESSNFLVALLHFCFRKTTVKSKFSDFFLPLRHPLVATFSETCAPTFWKYVSYQGIIMPNLSEKLQFWWLHPSIFALEKQPKNLNFQSSFTSKIHFGGYFQGKVSTHFQKIRIWT